jgi:hypothetical protein
MTRHWKASPLIAAAVLFAHEDALTQETRRTENGEAVPRELVMALLDIEIMGLVKPDLYVGKLPPRFPANFSVAPGGSVLGAVRYPIPTEDSAYFGLIVETTRDAPQVALTNLETTLTRNGWKKSSGAREQEGFVQSPGEGQPVRFCTGSAELNAVTKPRPAGGTYLKLFVAEGIRTTVCGGGSMFGQSPDRSEASMPTLVNPAGAVGLGNSTHSGPGSSERSVVLTIDMSLSALVEHYAKQLRDAGWITGNKITDSRMLMQTFAKKDEKGQQLIGILSAIQTTRPNSTMMSFRIITPDAIVPR